MTCDYSRPHLASLRDVDTQRAYLSVNLQVQDSLDSVLLYSKKEGYPEVP